MPIHCLNDDLLTRIFLQPFSSVTTYPHSCWTSITDMVTKLVLTAVILNGKNGRVFKTRQYTVADSGGASNVFLRTQLHESIKWLCRSGMQQQQPGIVTHSRISSLLISRHLTRPRVASRYSVRTSSVPEVGVTTQKFALRAPVAEPPFLDF